MDNLTLSDIEGLLIKDSSREFNQGFKSTIAGEISTSDSIYTLKATANKRLHIYENGVYNNTRPYNYNKIDINHNKNDA